MPSDYHIVDQELANFLESNVAILVAASNETNKPTISRGFGIRVSEDCEHVTVFVTDHQSEALLRDAQQTGRVVLNATRISDYESYQLKGGNAQINELSEKDRRHVDRYVEGVQLEMNKIGIEPHQSASIFMSQNSQAMVGITFALHEVFCQTPGPGAGKPRKPRA